MRRLTTTGLRRWLQVLALVLLVVATQTGRVHAQQAAAVTTSSTLNQGAAPTTSAGNNNGGGASATSSAAGSVKTGTPLANNTNGGSLPLNCDPTLSANGCPDLGGTQDCSTSYIPSWLSFLSPNISTIVPVGNSLFFNWSIAGEVAPGFPKKDYSVYYAWVGSSPTALGTFTLDARGWYANKIGSFPPTTTTFFWNVPKLSSGMYKVRVVADGVDPSLDVLNNQQTCLVDGQSLPGVSAVFRIVDNTQLQNFPDSYGPNTSGGGGGSARGPRWWSSVGVAACVAVVIGHLIL